MQATQVRHQVHTPGLVQPPSPKLYNFPTTLPTTILTSQQQKENYGIPKDDTPFGLRKEITNFSTWSQDPINLTRGLKYSHAIQASTLEGQVKHIRGFMGYMVSYFNVEPFDVSLSHYKDPEAFTSFISYLRARNVTRHPLMAHAGVWVAWGRVANKRFAHACKPKVGDTLPTRLARIAHALHTHMGLGLRCQDVCKVVICIAHAQTLDNGDALPSHLQRVADAVHTHSLRLGTRCQHICGVLHTNCNRMRTWVWRRVANTYPPPPPPSPPH
jgi:hypothetical protein